MFLELLISLTLRVAFINMTVMFDELKWHAHSPVDHLQDAVEQKHAADSLAEMMWCSHVNMDINKLAIIKSSCFSADVVSVSSQHDAIISSSSKVNLHRRRYRYIILCISPHLAVVSFLSQTNLSFHPDDLCLHIIPLCVISLIILLNMQANTAEYPPKKIPHTQFPPTLSCWFSLK